MKEPKHVVDRILDDEIKEESYKRLFERACEFMSENIECPVNWAEKMPCLDVCNKHLCWQKYFKEEAGE